MLIAILATCRLRQIRHERERAADVVRTFLRETGLSAGRTLSHLQKYHSRVRMCQSFYRSLKVATVARLNALLQVREGTTVTSARTSHVVLIQGLVL